MGSILQNYAGILVCQKSKVGDFLKMFGLFRIYELYNLGFVMDEPASTPCFLDKCSCRLFVEPFITFNRPEQSLHLARDSILFSKKCVQTLDFEVSDISSKSPFPLSTSVSLNCSSKFSSPLKLFLDCFVSFLILRGSFSKPGT
jgi:hypothetical protein